MQMRISATIVVSSLILTGCTGNDTIAHGGLDMAQLTDDQACALQSASSCEKLGMCDPVGLQISYGDMETCKTRKAMACKMRLGLDSSSWTTVSVQKCAAALTAASCDQYFADDPTALADCYYEPGMLPNGSACGSSSQCQSGACHFTGDCGVCGTLATLGDACTNDSDCGADLFCINSTCAKLPSVGQMCDPNVGCEAPFVCKSGICARGATAGAACTSDPDTCDYESFCSTSNVCQAYKLVAAGAACDESQGIYCEARGFCSPGPSGTCLKFAADGQACSDSNGPYCMSPAACISGVCKIANPSACK